MSLRILSMVALSIAFSFPVLHAAEKGLPLSRKAIVGLQQEYIFLFFGRLEVGCEAAAFDLSSDKPFQPEVEEWVAINARDQWLRRRERKIGWQLKEHTKPGIILWMQLSYPLVAWYDACCKLVRK